MNELRQSLRAVYLDDDFNTKARNLIAPILEEHYVLRVSEKIDHIFRIAKNIDDAVRWVEFYIR